MKTILNLIAIFYMFLTFISYISKKHSLLKLNAMKKNKLILILLSFVSVFSLTAQIDSIYYYNPDSTK